MAGSSKGPMLINPDATGFLYFDAVPTYGVLNGAIQIELAAHALNPLADGGVDAALLSVARLRCSPAAALLLKSTLEKALQMLTEPRQEPTTSGMN